MSLVYGYNAASHSLGVALHSGSGWLCRDPFFDIPKPLFVLKELVCLTTWGDLYRSQKRNRFVCFVVCCHWRHYYARMHFSRLVDLAESARYVANWQTVDKQLADHLVSTHIMRVQYTVYTVNTLLYIQYTIDATAYSIGIRCACAPDHV